ncbi:MAG: hypothetical protein ACK5LC_12105, partial [Coprobacillaceae bacterium]
MKKKLVIGASVVAVIAIAITTILMLLPGMNEAYKIERSGYTYDQDGNMQTFSEEATYNLESIYNLPTIADKNSSFTLNDGRILFLDSSEMELLSNSVAIVSKTQVYDLHSKTTIQSNSDTYNVGNRAKENDLKNVPKGSIIKLNQGQYLVLDDANLENGKDYSKAYTGGALLVSIDENKRIRIFSDGSYEETISNEMYLTLKSNGCKFMLADEELIFEEDTDTLDVGNIKVNFDDDAEKLEDKDYLDSKDEDKDTAADDTEVSGNADSSGTQSDSNGNSSGNGTSGSQTPTYPEINTITSMPYHIPLVDVNANSDKNTIFGDVLITDTDSRLQSLVIKLQDSNGNVIKEQAVNVDDANTTFNFSDLQYQVDYYLSVEGKYLGDGDRSIEAVFYRKNFNLDMLMFTTTLVDTTSDSITLQMDGDFSGVSSIVLGYYKNDGQSSSPATKTVNISALAANNNQVVIDGVDSNTSYYVHYDDVVMTNGQHLNSDWYLIANTKKKLPELGKVEVTYQDTKQVFKLKVDTIIDNDDAITALEYVAYLKDDYDANGVDATEYLSLRVDRSQILQEVQTFKNASMVNGEYIFVAKAHGAISGEPFTVISDPSDPITLNFSKALPEAEFTLESAGTSHLEVKHVITDADQTLVFSSTNKPVLEVYKTDGSGQPVGAPVNSITIENRTDLTMTRVFDGLEADTEYVIALNAMVDLDDGVGMQSHMIYSDPFMTNPIVPLDVTFTEVNIKSDGAIINIAIDDPNKDLTSVKIKITNLDDSTFETYEIDADDLLEIIETGKDLEILNLLENTNYRIELVEGKDSGNNAIPMQGSLDFTTGTLKDIPTITYNSYDSTANKITLNYEILDADGALIVSPEDYPTFEIYEVDAAGDIIGDPVNTVVLTTVNSGTSENVTFSNLTKLTKYRVVLKASYDINTLSGYANKAEIGTSDVLETLDVAPVNARITEDTIKFEGIDFKVEILSNITDITSASMSIYKVGSTTPIETIDISGDLLELASTDGKDYSFNSLERNTEYVIVLHDFSDGSNDLEVVGGEFEFTTLAAKTKPEATLEWDTDASTDSQLVIDYTINDPDLILNLTSELYKVRANLYYVQDDGSLGGLVSSQTISDVSDYTGTLTFTGLTAGREYKVIVTGTYDQLDGNGEQQNVMIGQSEVMYTRDSLVVRTFFSERTVTTNSIDFDVTIIDNHAALAGGSATLQIYKRGTDEAVGTPIVLTADEILRLTLGNSVTFSQSGLTQNTEYVVRFAEAKNSSNIDLIINES